MVGRFFYGIIYWLGNETLAIKYKRIFLNSQQKKMSSLVMWANGKLRGGVRALVGEELGFVGSCQRCKSFWRRLMGWCLIMSKTSCCGKMINFGQGGLSYPRLQPSYC